MGEKFCFKITISLYIDLGIDFLLPYCSALYYQVFHIIW